MLERYIRVNGNYDIKLRGKWVTIRIQSICDRGGWYAKNLQTGRTMWVSSANLTYVHN